MGEYIRLAQSFLDEQNEWNRFVQGMIDGFKTWKIRPLARKARREVQKGRYITGLVLGKLVQLGLVYLSYQVSVATGYLQPDAVPQLLQRFAEV